MTKQNTEKKPPKGSIKFALTLSKEQKKQKQKSLNTLLILLWAKQDLVKLY